MHYQEMFDAQILLKLSSEFFRFAAGNYEPFREKVKQLALKNSRPFKSWFPNGNRIYIPFQKIEKKLSDDDKRVLSALERFLGSDCEINYKSGIVIKDGHKFRIAKLLEKLKKDTLKQIEDQSGNIKSIVIKFYDELILIFNNSKARELSSSDDLVIVISQDPHDIAQMSTGRGWRSCMTIDKNKDEAGKYMDDVFCEVESGGLIAYLTTANDLEVTHPIARVLIRRFADEDGNNIAFPENKVYGTDTPGFLDTVKKFVNGKQGKIIPSIYKRRGGNYSDTLKNVFVNTKNFNGRDLFKVNFHDADLTGADFGNSDLTAADLSHADLSDANFNGAKMIGTDLTGANLIHVDFTNTELMGANLLNAKRHPNDEKIPGWRINEHTKLLEKEI